MDRDDLANFVFDDQFLELELYINSLITLNLLDLTVSCDLFSRVGQYLSQRNCFNQIAVLKNFQVKYFRRQDVALTLEAKHCTERAVGVLKVNDVAILAVHQDAVLVVFEVGHQVLLLLLDIPIFLD
jgi:hypothetical protein